MMTLISLPILSETNRRNRQHSGAAAASKLSRTLRPQRPSCVRTEIACPIVRDFAQASAFLIPGFTEYLMQDIVCRMR